MKKTRNSQKTTLWEAPQSHKKVWVMVLFILFSLLLVGTVSAADWDNVKKYDRDTQTITIKNAFGLPLIGNTIAEIQLRSNIREVLIFRGYQKVAIMEIRPNQNYEDIIENIELYNKRDGEPVNRTLDLKYQTYEDVERPVFECVEFDKEGFCIREIQKGTEIVNQAVWKDFDGNVKSEENILIGIYADVQRGDYIEWVPKIAGVRIKEWAAWVLTDFTYDNVNISTQSLVPTDLFFKPDGTKLYEITTTRIYQSTCITGWDLNSCSYDNVNISTQDGVSTDLFFKPDGTKLYEIGTTGDKIYQYTCSDAWNLSSCSYNNVNISSQNTAPSGLFFKSDGTKLYEVGADGDKFYQYTCSTPWLLSTCSYNNVNISSQDTYSNDLFFKSDGAKLYEVGSDGDKFYQYTCSDAWNLSSCSYDNVNISTQDGTSQGLFFKSDGAKLYETGYGGDKIYQYSSPGIEIAPLFPEDETYFTINSINFSANVSDPGSLGIQNVTLEVIYPNGTLFYSETNDSGIEGIYNFTDITISDGNWNWSVNVYDDTNEIYESDMRVFLVDTTDPFLNLTAPSGLLDFGILTVNETLNWTATDDHLDSCWFNYNFTNTTVTCGDNTTNFTLTSQRNLTFYANDTFGHLVSNFTTWDYKVFQNYLTYNNETYEMESEVFSINTSSNGSKITLGYLIYNGTSYLATKTGTNYEMEFNRTITLNQTGNVSFYWSFNYGGDIINTSTYYQNVSEILMGFCGGSLTTQTLNFTAYDEEDLSRIMPYDFYGTFEYWTGDGSITKNFSISNESVNDVTICININNTFYSNAKIQYENTSFVKRNYYLVNESLTNSSQDKKLFLLNTSSSTSFIIEVEDEVQFPIEDVYVYIQRYYPGTGQYETVEMCLTDGSGSTLGHFEAETEDYRIIIEQDGVIIFQSGTQKIFCRETPCTLSFQTEAGAGITWDEFGAIDSFSWTLDYDEGTEVWTFTYTDTSGSIGYGRLYVYYEEPDAGKITICNTTSALLADTLTCDVTGYNGTIYGAAYLSRSPEILVYLRSIIISALKTIFALEGLFLMMFVLLVLGLAGLWNPAVGIILTLGGVLVFNIIGIASFGAVTIWGLILIGLILLVKLKT